MIWGDVSYYIMILLILPHYCGIYKALDNLCFKGPWGPYEHFIHNLWGTMKLFESPLQSFF